MDNILLKEVNETMDFISEKLRERVPSPTKRDVAKFYLAFKTLAEETAQFILKTEEELKKNPCQCENCVNDRGMH